MTRHVGYIHGSKLESFLPPSFCQSGAGLEDYTYYYQKYVVVSSLGKAKQQGKGGEA